MRIGAEISKSFASAENHIFVHYRNSSVEAERLSLEIRHAGGECSIIHSDLSGKEGCASLVSAIFERVDELHVLVNCAAEFSYDWPTSFEYEDFERVIKTNLMTPLFLMKEISNRLPPQSEALFVNILDQKIQNLNPDYFSYTISKCALASASEIFAMVLAKRGIRVISISPGVTLPSGPQTIEEFSASGCLTPLGISSSPQDIVSAIRFAIVCKSMTGTNLIIDGGESLFRRERDVAFWKQQQRSGQ